jgi:succinate dehydrogenase / fumarate reductase cytochrome b subunit
MRMAADNRPVSPHLQIYRFRWTMALSILHRITGVFLSLGAVFLVCWLAALAAGPEAFARANALAVSVPGRMVMLAWTLALYYHLANGIRHLFWDAGRGFELGVARLSGYAVVVIAVLLTLATWFVAYSHQGAGA